MSTGHLIDRPARLTPCHGCGRHVLAAVSAGITVAADPESLTINAEIAARLTGRATYDILILALKPYLEYRSLFRMSPHRRFPVVADHACGARPVYQLIPPKPSVRKRLARAAVRVEEKCPF